MLSLVMIVLISVMLAIPSANAQRNPDFINPLPQRTPETDREALRLMRSDKLDLVLPGAMRDNNVDMWISAEGCTEIELLVQQEHVATLPLLPSTEIHIETAANVLLQKVALEDVLPSEEA